MKVVSSIGNGFTGSTAITDLLKEYSSVGTCSVSSFELDFFYDIHGIFCLYTYLVKFRTPLAMIEATREYLRWAEKCANCGTKMNYEKFFNNQFISLTEEYIDRLGGHDYVLVDDFADLSVTQEYILRIISKIRALLYKFKAGDSYAQNHLKPLTLFSKKIKSYQYLVDEEKFVKETKWYFDQLIHAYTKKEIANFHALIPMNMIDECVKYFDDIVIISTERDPRDVYLNKKYRWDTINNDSHDIKTFCKNYRWLRTIVNEIKTDRIINIQFEDLVFHYDKTVSEIESFVGLNPKDHIDYKKYFIPEKAASNCKLAAAYVEEKENIAFIERELSEWIYDFR